MQSVWKVPGGFSGVNPPAFVPGEPPPVLPPDPPDPSSPLSPVNFPSLTEASSKTVSTGGRKSHRKESLTLTTTASVADKTKKTTTNCSESTSMEIELENSTLSTDGTVQELRSETATVHPENSEANLNQNYSILPPQATSPVQTNKASSSNQTLIHKPLLDNPQPASNTTIPVEPSVQNQTLVEKLRASADMSLKRLAPVTIAPSGSPRVVIPGSVFKKGANIHKYFIICYFNGKSPPFNQIQNVFNFVWGKGKKLEIHNNPLNHSVIVRIQSDYLRQKILDKYIWYVGDSMFHTAQWNSSHSGTTPTLKAIKIWAHLTGVPLDLRYDE